MYALNARIQLEAENRPLTSERRCHRLRTEGKPKILDYGASQLASQRLIFTPALVFHPFPQHPCRTGFFEVEGFEVAVGDGNEQDDEDGISRRPVIAATVRAASNPLGRECKGLSESGSRSAMPTPEFAMHGRD
jgi:hypothetical protein